MAYLIGIDTGGTYTDTVLLDTSTRKIVAKAKSFTTKEDLALGIGDSIARLGTLPEDIARVVLSTTLATNAVVEGKLHPVGLIFLGKKPAGTFPALCCQRIDGSVNVKGREECPLNRGALIKAVNEMVQKVDAIAVTGYMSVRNPIQEQQAMKLIRDHCGLPVVCAHHLSGALGYRERSVTAALNAGLIPIIKEFVTAVSKVLSSIKVDAPVFMVRGDGTMAKLDAVMDRPIDTVLSGPVTSVIGAKYLTGAKNAMVCDMGGTTTDVTLLTEGEVSLRHGGATVGGWQTKIPSVDIITCGIGGDSLIQYSAQEIKVGPKRTMPLCRGGEHLTPTDVLHYTGELTLWPRRAVEECITATALKAGTTPDQMAAEIKEKIAEKIETDCISPWNVDSDIPVIAVGAPVRQWFPIVCAKGNRPLTVPEHHEVANAVGAAAAELKEVVEAVIRPGEEGYGYIVHTRDKTLAAADLDEALTIGLRISQDIVEKKLRADGAVFVNLETWYEHIYLDNSEPPIYIETKIKVTAYGFLR